MSSQCDECGRDCGCLELDATRLRKWITWKTTLGQIDKQVRDAMEQCADDMEAGDA